MPSTNEKQINAIALGSSGKYNQPFQLKNISENFAKKN